MGNGKPGDHPISDMTIYGKHPFPSDIEAMLREVLALEPHFPFGSRLHVDQMGWERRFFDWERGEGLDEGRDALRRVLNELRASPPQPPAGGSRYSAMTVRERLGEAGLLQAFDEAALRRDRARMIELLQQVEFSEYEGAGSTDIILADPAKYGF